MSNIRNDFPILKNNPDLIYLDSTATSQKSAYMIDGVKEYLESSYANIHRGSYDISAQSEKMYEQSKQAAAKYIGAENWREIIYTANSTYALNLLAQSIWRTGLLRKWDKVLVSIVEHHANVVPWLILKEDYGIEVEYINIKDDYSLDYEDFRSKLDDNVKIVSLTHVSNVTGQVFDLENVNSLLNMRYGSDRPLFIVDGSQSVPHFSVDVKTIGCDAMFFTGHKLWADSGIGILWAKESLLAELKPIFSGGGAIWHVSKDGFTHSAQLPDKFEPGTPNLSGAVSLLKAFEYIESVWGYEKLEQIEQELTEYSLEKFKNIQWVKLIGWTDLETRVWVFTFVVEGVHSFDISDYLADHNICIRAGQHCAEPFLSSLWLVHTCRMSLYMYNTKADIDTFFEILEKAINDLK